MYQTARRDFLILATLGSVVALYLFAGRTFSIGVNDFTEYWSSFQLFRSGQNPYDPSLLWGIEKEVGWKESQPLMMWNPPWLLVIMAPVLMLPFLLASFLWLVLGIVALIGTGLLLHRVVASRETSVAFALLGAVSFYPCWTSLQLGQVGVLLALLSALLYVCLITERWFLAGFVLALMTIKPHLFYLVGIALLWWLLRTRNLRLLLGLGCGFVLLFIPTFLISPTSFSSWLQATSGHSWDGSFTRVAEWRVATIVEPIRSLFANKESSAPWVIVVVPGICAIVLLFWLIRARPNIEWKRFFPPLLAFSVFTCPFGWVFDHSVLVLLQVVLLVRACECFPDRRAFLAVALLFLLQIVTLVSKVTWITEHHQYFWFPGALLVVWFVSDRLLAGKWPKTEISGTLES